MTCAHSSTRRNQMAKSISLQRFFAHGAGETNHSLNCCYGILGIDPSRPDAWKVGFLLLAFYHHGAGQLAWFRRRTNANSATWKPEHDLTEVIALKSRGFSESGAVRELAKNPGKRALFPYRPRGYSSKGGVKQREAALWKRWQKLKAQSRDGTRLAEILGARTQALSPVEQLLYALDTPQLVLPKL